ncbi:unnamed protein product [marine sediment metagenome]|uniref:MacB-like periplasmic core domain-containing protein n=1 Tax=marine sediment metagenome TaxID=412755 RepID=X1ILG6_9ZZZZ
MSFLNTLRTVIESVSHSKLRSLLTILGIIIGVAAVILVLALGTGATQSVMERFRFLGSNQVDIYSVSSHSNPDTKPITFDEALGMEELSLVERVHVSLGGLASAARGWAKLDTSITGILYVPLGILYVPLGILYVPLGILYVPLGILQASLGQFNLKFLYSHFLCVVSSKYRL